MKGIFAPAVVESPLTPPEWSQQGAEAGGDGLARPPGYEPRRYRPESWSLRRRRLQIEHHAANDTAGMQVLERGIYL